MNKSKLALLCCLLLSSTWSIQEDPLLERVATITLEECQGHVDVLASPAYGGRATPSPGLELAGAYVETQLTTLGFEPAGTEGSFRLPWTLNSITSGDSQLVWSRKKEEHELKAEAEFVPVLGSKEAAAEGEAVFVGYAIDARNERWQDLPARKVKGKVVFAFTREPRADDPKSKKFDGIDATRHSNFGIKAKAVADAGAIALVLVPDPGAFLDSSIPLPGMMPVPLPDAAAARALERLSRWPAIPVMSCSRDVASAIFGTSIEDYFASIEKKRRPRLLKAPSGTKVELEVAWDTEERDYWNLGAWLRGSDDDGEAVVLGAHLDHVGHNYSAGLWGGEVALHPGADDNASGSSALLEVAQALAGTQPKKDILFLWFTGEERGLLGSRAYCQNPVVAHEKTIAMLNMDQIARTNPKTMNIGGLWDKPAWAKAFKRVHKRIKNPLKLDTKYGRDLFHRSDQYPFHQQGVDAFFFFEGDINDNLVYHKPGDVAATIEAKKLMWIARDFLAVAWVLAFDEVRP